MPPQTVTDADLPSDSLKIQFLQAQISYVTSHLQLADAKAAGVIAYLSLVCGYTFQRWSDAGTWPHGWALACTALGLAFSLMAFTTSFLTLLPRPSPGRNLGDPFSWVGLSAASEGRAYPDRFSELTVSQMERGLADTVEACAIIIRTKYHFVRIAIWSAVLSTAVQALSWMFPIK